MRFVTTGRASSHRFCSRRRPTRSSRTPPATSSSAAAVPAGDAGPATRSSSCSGHVRVRCTRSAGGASPGVRPPMSAIAAPAAQVRGTPVAFGRARHRRTRGRSWWPRDAQVDPAPRTLPAASNRYAWGSTGMPASTWNDAGAPSPRRTRTRPSASPTAIRAVVRRGAACGRSSARDARLTSPSVQRRVDQDDEVEQAEVTRRARAAPPRARPPGARAGPAPLDGWSSREQDTPGASADGRRPARGRGEDGHESSGSRGSHQPYSAAPGDCGRRRLGRQARRHGRQPHGSHSRRGRRGLAREREEQPVADRAGCPASSDLAADRSRAHASMPGTASDAIDAAGDRALVTAPVEDGRGDARWQPAAEWARTAVVTSPDVGRLVPNADARRLGRRAVPVGGRRSARDGGSAGAEQLGEPGRPDPAELARLGAGAVEDRDLEVLGRDHPVARRRRLWPEGRDGERGAPRRARRPRRSAPRGTPRPTSAAPPITAKPCSSATWPS